MSRAVSILFIFLGVCASSAGFGGEIPRIKYLGVVPATWEKSAEDIIVDHSVRSYIEDAYYQAVHKAAKFQTLNDDLVKQLWSTPEGRQELVQEHELGAFIALGVYVDNDVVTLRARMLDSNLQQNYLMETDRQPVSLIKKAEAKDIENLMESLIFRVFNRIPFDVVVTSLQGKYITVSGGLAQSISQGDNLEFFRTSVSSLHPANGTWYGFSQKKLGNAVVVEVKQNTSVAKITSQAFENALQIGDGAKIPKIASRRKFLAASGEDAAAGGKEPVELAPMYDKNGNKIEASDEEWEKGEQAPEPKREPAAADKPTTPSPEVPQAAEPVPPEAPTPVAPEESQEEPAAAEEATESSGPSAFSQWMDGLTLKGSDVKAFGGLDLWSAKGSASASAKMPLWIFNHFGLKAEKEVSSVMGYGYGATLGYGPTKGGSFFGFGLNADMNYRIAVKDLWSELDFLRFGGRISFDSYAVKSESFGGGDYFAFKGYSRLEGRTKLGSFSTPIGWSADLELPLLAMGNMGSSGKSRSISSVSGYKLGFSANMEQKKAQKLGAEFALTSQSYGLSKGSISLDGVYLGIFAIYPF
ncbi:MAG: hypothetical protein AB7T49_16735 [Oligoflexales bacterium]